MISAPPTPASEPSPICERCKTDQDPFCIGCERLKEHDRAIREDTFEEGKKAALLELDNLNLCTVTGYEAGLKEGTRKGALEMTIDDFCFVDLYWYIHETDRESEDVSRCRGESCNYCGKFNRRLPQPPEQGPAATQEKP